MTQNKKWTTRYNRKIKQNTIKYNGIQYNGRLKNDKFITKNVAQKLIT